MDFSRDADLTKALGLTSPEAIAAVREGVGILETEADLAFGKVLQDPIRQAGMGIVKMVLEVSDIPEEAAENLLQALTALERRAFNAGVAFGATVLHDKLRARGDLIGAVMKDEGLKERKAAEKLAAGDKPA